MKKVIFVATVVKLHIMEFHIPYLRLFQGMGWKTAVAARNDYENPEDCRIPCCDTYYDIPFSRSPFSPENIRAYRMLKDILEDGGYDIIHCHTPVGGILARIAAKSARRQGTKVIYTAHGFHFYRGAPLMNWLVYFPAEWLCSFWTDILITINKEDYGFAGKHMHAGRVEYVPGVGVDLEKFGACCVDRQKKRAELDVPSKAVWILTVGELSARKNQEALIRAVSDIPDVYVTFAGQGDLEMHLDRVIHDLGLEDRVKLIGYRTDISELCEAADIFAFPSLQEGLPVALMEAMACGMPVVCSAVRGNTDLIDREGGEMFNPCSVGEIREAIIRILARDRKKMGMYNAERIRGYDIGLVMERMKRVYGSEITRGGGIDGSTL